MWYLLIFSFICSSLSALETQVLFILCEQKETKALLPVIKAMEKEKRDYRILSAGPSAAYFQDPSLVARCLFLKGDKDDTHEITKEQVDAIVDYLQPRVVLSGNSSIVQKQLLEGFKEKAVTIAYRDRAQNVTHAHEQQVEGSAKEIFSTAKDGSATHAVGNPYMENLRDKILKCNKAALLEKLGLDRRGGQFVGFIDDSGMSLFPLAEQGAWKCALDDKESYLRISDTLSSWPLEEQIAVVDVLVSCDEALLIAASAAGKRVLFWKNTQEEWTGELPQEQLHLFSWEDLGIPENSVEIFLEELDGLVK